MSATSSNFYEFHKITTAYPSQKSPIIVNFDSILTIDANTFENKEDGLPYEATRIEIEGTPKHSFYVSTLLNTVMTNFDCIDATGLFVPGSSFNGGTGIDTYYPYPTFPLIKAKMVFNNTVNESRDFVFNPIHLMYAESVIFKDSSSGVQQTALMIALRDSPPRKILTLMNYSMLVQILQPTSIL